MIFKNKGGDKEEQKMMSANMKKIMIVEKRCFQQLLTLHEWECADILELTPKTEVITPKTEVL